MHKIVDLSDWFLQIPRGRSFSSIDLGRAHGTIRDYADPSSGEERESEREVFCLEGRTKDDPAGDHISGGLSIFVTRGRVRCLDIPIYLLRGKVFGALSLEDEPLIFDLDGRDQLYCFPGTLENTHASGSFQDLVKGGSLFVIG